MGNQRESPFGCVFSEPFCLAKALKKKSRARRASRCVCLGGPKKDTRILRAAQFCVMIDTSWGPKTLLCFGQKALPEKSGHTATYDVRRFFFLNILSTKYGFYTAKYGQLRQMTEKNNLSGKNRPNMPFDRKKVAFRGSRLVLNYVPNTM